MKKFISLCCAILMVLSSIGFAVANEVDKTFCHKIN